MKEIVFKKLKWYEKILFMIFKKYARKIYIAGMMDQFEQDNICEKQEDFQY